jgi:cell surface protein SprA
MADQKTDEAPFRTIVEAAAYFLSGLFLITTTIIHVSGTDVSIEIPNTTVTLAIGSWLTLFIGSLLALTGFLYLSSTIISPLKVLFDKKAKFEKWIFAFLFATVMTEVIKKVFELYDPNDNSSTAMQRAFVEGFESFPLISKVSFLKDFANFIPRPNWEINWDGLEKFSLFESFAKKVSLNHIYSSGLSESWNINTDGSKNVTAEKINYGFAPLLGLSITFNSFWDGNMTGSIRYSTKSAYDLALSSRSITESYTSDIGVTASYSKSGFEWPLFGVSLKNDIEVSFSYTKGTTSSVQYSLEDENENGEPLDGTVRTSLEPRLKYVVSSKVTLSVFYKRTSVEPEGASRITPTTTNEAGLDIHISIQ